MTFSFDKALSSPRDRVRFEIGDTNFNDVEFEDETIDYFLGSESTELGAAYRLALAGAAKYSRLVDTGSDHQLTKSSQAAANYSAMASRILVLMGRKSPADAGTGFGGIAALGVGTGPTEGYGPYEYPGLVPQCAPNPALPVWP